MPIFGKIGSVKRSPLLYQAQNSRRELTFDDFTGVYCDDRFKISVPGMEMWWRVIVIIHRYNDPEESTDLRPVIAPDAGTT